MRASRESGARRSGVLSALGVAALMLTGCVEEPGPNPIDSDYRPIWITVDASSPEQRVLGELYGISLNNRSADPSHAHVSLDRPTADGRQLGRLQNRSGDLIIGCTGSLLYELNPSLALELSEQYQAEQAAGETAQEQNTGNWREEVYDAMVGSLPGNLAAGDPSNVQACDNYDGPPLPQNLVAVYRKPMLDRLDHVALNRVGGTLTNEDLAKLVEETSNGNDPIRVARQYAQGHDI
ncbi:hypothetical protein ACFPVT_00845 [Corynebacterium choanae]|nr:hypothetical protein [Corynebacterium choanae]